MTKTARLEVRIDPALKARLDAYADANPGTIAEHVRYAVREYLERRGDNMRDLAQNRVDRTPELRAYEDVIMYDWPEGDEHWQWVAGAPVDEIVDWVETIAAD